MNKYEQYLKTNPAADKLPKLPTVHSERCKWIAQLNAQLGPPNQCGLKLDATDEKGDTHHFMSIEWDGPFGGEPDAKLCGHLTGFGWVYAREGVVRNRP